MDKEHKEVSTKLIKITILSLMFMGVELVGGYLANSIAIFADAFHLLSDVLAYLISLGAVWLSTRPSSPPYLTFGFQKAEPLGALFNIAVIYIVTGELFVQATKRMINRQVVEQPKYMLMTSVFGLICNIIIMSILHNDPHGGHQGCSHGHHGHSHSHQQQSHSHPNETCSGKHLAISECSQSTAHSHPHPPACSHSHSPSCAQKQHDICTQNHSEHPHIQDKDACLHEERNSGDQLTVKQCCKSLHSVEEQLGGCVTSDEELHLRETPKKIKNINLEAAYVHILTDIILSIGVIVSALIIYFLSPDHHTWSPWQLADPLCTYLFSFLAIYSTWPILKEAVLLLLDASHGEHIPTDLAMEIAELGSVKELLKLRVWSTNRAKHYAAVKVRMQNGYGGQSVKRLLKLKGLESYVEIEEQAIER